MANANEDVNGLGVSSRSPCRPSYRLQRARDVVARRDNWSVHELGALQMGTASLQAAAVHGRAGAAARRPDQGARPAAARAAHADDAPHPVRRAPSAAPGFDRGPLRLHGGRATVHQTQIARVGGREVAVGPAYRMVTDLTSAILWTALPGGPSDRRLSHRYASGVRAWLDGRLKAVRAGTAPAGSGPPRSRSTSVLRRASADAPRLGQAAVRGHPKRWWRSTAARRSRTRAGPRCWQAPSARLRR